ncbi:sensor histidine kinase [Mucilaginibacter endophyticus]|uniref:sensor histidine kinase n=1 Tax=Mucilaginibacter endophyticus TaxID=2675003 RepID=UPI0012B16AC5|nr:sensor histidine kinase [Mucilaginibacter endophyticus]
MQFKSPISEGAIKQQLKNLFHDFFYCSRQNYRLLFRRGMKDRCFAVIFTVFAVLPSIVAAKPVYSLFFRKFTPENGLVNSHINVILMDRRGFLWIGTEDGLQRFDGKYFTDLNFADDDKDSPKANIITGLCQGNDDDIWIATANGGLFRYDYRQSAPRRFKRYAYKETDPYSLPPGRITNLNIDSDGNLWMIIDNELLVNYKARQNRFYKYAHLWKAPLLSLTIGKDNSIWIGGESKLLGNFNAEKRCLNLIENQSSAVTTIYIDKEGTIWYGDNKGKLFYRTKGRKLFLEHTLSKQIVALNDMISSIVRTPNGQLYVGFRNSGLACYDPLSRSVCRYLKGVADDGSISDDHINIVYPDERGNIWLGTNNGLNQISAIFSPFKRVVIPKVFRVNQIFDLYEDIVGNLWIATDRGVLRESGKDHHIDVIVSKYKGQDFIVNRFYRDVDGAFYWGTNYSLFRYNDKSGTVAILPNTEEDPMMRKLKNSTILSIARDNIKGHPALLISLSNRFLRYYDLTDKRWIAVNEKNVQKEIWDDKITKIYNDNNGHLWLATWKSGLGDLTCNSNQPVIHYHTSSNTGKGGRAMNVYDIEKDFKGDIWISSYGGGLYKMDTVSNTLDHVEESSNLTEGFLPDKENNLWMICNGHFHKYDSKNRRYTCYDIPELRTNEGVRGFPIAGESGNIFAAGNDYYVKFDPQQVPKINLSPKVYFTDFSIFNKSFNKLLYGAGITLEKSQNYFTIDFSAPDYGGDNIQYLYRMVGIDSNWVMAGIKNSVSYSNLKAGKYEFQVKASNWKGNYASNFSSLQIIVEPPFYEQYWFSLLVIMIICSIIYHVYMYQIRELKKIQDVRNGIARDLHDQVGSTLSSIAVYTEVAKIFQQQNKRNDVEQLLKIISETATSIVQEMTDIIWSIDAKNDHIISIVKRIESYAKPLCAAKGIKFSIDADAKLFHQSMSMSLRKNLFLILKEAINNAIKHADCKTLKAVLSVDNETISLEVKDDGVGFDYVHDNSGLSGVKGNGLSNMKNRAEQMNGLLRIVTSGKSGTSLTVTFKIV